MAEEWLPVGATSLEKSDPSTGLPRHPSAGSSESVPVSVRPGITPYRQVADLGQNINGWVRLTDVLLAGSNITLVHGESLDRSVVLHHQADSSTRGMTLASGPFQVDEVTSAGDVDEVLSPVNHPRVPVRPSRGPPSTHSTLDDLSGVVVHTDLRRTGWFRCSDDSLNRWHHLSHSSFRDNACAIATDRPQRVSGRDGRGHGQLFTPTARVALRRDGVLTQMGDASRLAAEQLSYGCVTKTSSPIR